MKNILCLEEKEARSHRIFSSEWQERKKERRKEREFCQNFDKQNQLINIDYDRK